MGSCLVVEVFAGRGKGFSWRLSRYFYQCDTCYHHLQHALESGLVSGYLHCPDKTKLKINAEETLLPVILSFFHDFGMRRQPHEAGCDGASFLSIHEERNVEFAQDYLLGTSLKAYADWAEIIMLTKQNFTTPEHWTDIRALLAKLIASSDLITQMSDRCYLEKEYGGIIIS